MSVRNAIRAVLVMAVLLAAAYGGGVASAQPAPLKIAYSVVSLEFPFFVNMVKQLQDEAAALGGIELTVLDAKNQTVTQADDLAKVIAEGYDGLLITPINAATLVPAVQAVIDAGIPVVTVDRSVRGVELLAHVSADNVRGGAAQAELIMSLFPKGARVVNLQGTPGSTAAIDRNRGLREALKGKAEYNLILEKTANFRRADAAKVLNESLDFANPPDVISAANDDMALGAVDVLKERGLIGKVAVIGYDALPEALVALQEGALVGTVEQFPGGQARRALQILVAFLREGKQPDETNILLPPAMLTKANIDKAERLAEAKALMGATPEATAKATAEATPGK
jgi:ABC-type sugar transport system substrate-binding protein